MAELLEYKYCPGDVLQYLFTVTIILETPGAAKIATRSTFNGRLKVLGESGGGIWSIELRIDPLELEGAFRELPDRMVINQAVYFTQQSSGVLLPNQDVPAILTYATFPRHAVNEGERWIVTYDMAAGPLEIRYMVRDFERGRQEIIAHIVCESQRDDENEGCTSLTESAYGFSVTYGHLIESTTVTEMVWDSGEKLSTVVEARLTERS